jgi:hypothetical protein
MRKPGQEHGSAGTDHQQDSVLRPLQEPLLLSSAMLPDQPMAQMLSSEHNEDMHSRPFSAEMETEVRGRLAFQHVCQWLHCSLVFAERSSCKAVKPPTHHCIAFVRCFQALS